MPCVRLACEVLLTATATAIDMHGTEATAELRKAGYDGVVIGVTGNVMQDDTDHFLRSGADAVLSKPLSIPKLVTKCHSSSYLSCVEVHSIIILSIAFIFSRDDSQAEGDVKEHELRCFGHHRPVRETVSERKNISQASDFIKSPQFIELVT